MGSDGHEMQRYFRQALLSESLDTNYPDLAQVTNPMSKALSTVTSPVITNSPQG